MWIGLLFFLISLFQLVLGVISILYGGFLADFSVYYSYTRVFLAGVNPYTPANSLNYPPSSLPFFIPFSLLPSLLSESLFTLFSLGFFLFTSWIYMETVGIKQKGWRFIFLAILLQLFPTKFTLGMGQINLFVIGNLLLIPFFEKKKKDVASGILWGISCMLKLIPLPLGMYFLLRKKWTSFIVGISLFLGVNGFFLYSFHFSEYFTRQLPSLFALTSTSNSPYDQSLRTFLTRLGIENSTQVSLGIIAILIAISISFFLRVSKNNPLRPEILFSLFIAISTIAGSFTWQHHLVFLYPGIIVLWSIFLKKKTPLMQWGVFAISIILIGIHIPDPIHPPGSPILVSHALLGTLLVIYLLLMKLRT